jgi:hypothetical protein
MLECFERLFTIPCGYHGTDCEDRSQILNKEGVGITRAIKNDVYKQSKYW